MAASEATTATIIIISLIIIGEYVLSRLWLDKRHALRSRRFGRMLQAPSRTSDIG